MSSYAIVLTHNRPELLERCLIAISPQVDKVVVVDNASDPPARLGSDSWPSNFILYEDPLQPPNLAYLWNQQFDRIASWEAFQRGEQWDIAVLCDDAIAPPDWFATVRAGMREHGAAAAFTSDRPFAQVKREPDNDIYGRMVGHAFVVAGEKQLRANETMLWWYLDTDMDFQARLAGGMANIPGPIVYNEQPNYWTNAKHELGTQAGLDREAFRAYWGSVPW